MADKNFIVKNGLEVGGQEVVSSSGVVTSAALGGQTLASTDSPTFNNLTLTNDIEVGGDLNLTGDLNITGDVNSLSVTDLDVTDQTITLGAGQVESASGGSGIVVDGSGASILWDETNDVFDFNKGFTSTGNVGIGAGATSPSNLLHVQESQASSTLIYFKNASATAASVLALDTGGTGTNTKIFDARVGGTSKFMIYGNGTAEIARPNTGDTNPLLVLSGPQGIMRLGDGQADNGGPHGIQFDYYGVGGVATDGMSLYYRTDPEHISFEDSTGISGNKVIVIERTGNVGIGTDSPDTIMEIKGADPVLTIRDSSTGIADANATLRLAESGASDSLGNHFDIGLGNNGILSFSYSGDGSAASEKIRFTADGNLQMIGQTSSFASPGFTYHTNNYLYCRGGSAGLILSDDSGINTVQIIDGSAGYINFETGDGSSRMRINSSRLEIDPTNDRYKFTYDGSSFNEGLRMAPHSNDYSILTLGAGTGDSGSVDGQWTIARHPDADNNKFTLRHQSDSIALTVLKSGNVGIGVDAPSQKLEVDGRIKLGGMILQNTSDGGSIGFNRNPADGSDISGQSLRRFQLNGPNTVGGDFWEFQSYNSSGTSVGNIRIQDGRLGIGVTPSARLELDNPSAFTNMIEYGNVTWNQNTGHGLVAVNRGSDGYVQLQITSGVADADVFSVRYSGTGANLMHNMLSNGNAAHEGQVNAGRGTAYDTEGNLICYGSGQNSLIIQTPDNALDRGIAFRNSGGAYIGNIYITNTGGNLGDMVFGVSNATETDVTNVEERMRITNDNGTVCINAVDTDSLVTKLWAEWDTGTANRGPVIFTNPNTGTAHRVMTVNTGGNSKLIVFDKGFSSKGSISTNGTSTAYNTTSDYRLKENISYTWDATTRLKQLKPARFNFIEDETNTLMDGFIAHEVSNIVPEAVVGEKDAVDDDDNPIYQEMDAAKLIPLLVKTIQEMEARITELEG